MAEFVELVLTIGAEGMSVWRYLYSPSFRRASHARWRAQSRLEAALEILAYSCNFVLVAIIAALLIWWMSAS